MRGWTPWSTCLSRAMGPVQVENEKSVSVALVEFRVELFCTIRTDPVAEVSLGAIPDIRFNLIPIPLIITDLLAGCTDGKQAAQGFDFRKGVQKPVVFPPEARVQFRDVP